MRYGFPSSQSLRIVRVHWHEDVGLARVLQLDAVRVPLVPEFEDRPLLPARLPHPRLHRVADLEAHLPAHLAALEAFDQLLLVEVSADEDEGAPARLLRRPGLAGE